MHLVEQPSNVYRDTNVTFVGANGQGYMVRSRVTKHQHSVGFQSEQSNTQHISENSRVTYFTVANLNQRHL